jgi:PKD domain
MVAFAAMRLRVLASLVLVGACGGGGGGGPDGDAGAHDAAIGPDGGPDAATPLSWVDFAVSGCASSVEDPPRCSAVAPAPLAFVAIAPAPITVWRWAFGDGSEASLEASPVHEYQVPGVYDVTLTVAGPGGTALAERPMRIEIVPAEPGATCGLDAQCAPAGECICGEGEGCEAPIASGLCARSCDGGGACASGQACADLAVAGGVAPWRRALCLRQCSGDAECPAGRACRVLPAGGGGWLRGCFVAGLVADVGGSCTDASGAPDDRRCASGDCAALGARGMCTASCSSSADCPPGAACATFTSSGAHTCLARCDAFACDRDPWLACVPPGGAGRLGFTIDESPAASGYCAPRPCSNAADCGPDGACTLGFCAAP